MRYELLVQSKDPATPYDPAGLDRLLHERGAEAMPDGSRRLRLKHGDVGVRLLVEGGKAIATELKVELSDRLELIRELVVEGASIAEAAGLRLVDPQLAKTVTAKDEGIVADQYLRTAQYAGQYAGVSTAVIASFGQLDAEEGLKPGTKVMLALGVFFFVLYVVADYLL